MLKVLLVDDDPTSVETLIEDLETEIGVDSRTVGFNAAEVELLEFLPDVVILDIIQGPIAENDRAGLANLEFIWDTCFCPVVVYSAGPLDIDEEIGAHPFVRLEQKGSGSEAKVILGIREFMPHIEALNGVQNEIRQHVNRQLRDIAPILFSEITEPGKRNSVLIRTSRRRIAAMMDVPLNDEIASWEQYLWPPVGSHLLAGDIIRRQAGEKEDPSSYYLVLTPSCDLASGEGRVPKVESVLVACCSGVKKMLSEPEVNAEPSLASLDPQKLQKRLVRFLRKGYGTACVPLPEFPSIFPAMTAEMKTLELIELSKIGESDADEFCRVVSVDSPFREMIAWAYTQIAGRPGLPKRDFETWAKGICSDIASQNEETTE